MSETEKEFWEVAIRTLSTLREKYFGAQMSFGTNFIQSITEAKEFAEVELRDMVWREYKEERSFPE